MGRNTATTCCHPPAACDCPCDDFITVEAPGLVNMALPCLAQALGVTIDQCNVSICIQKFDSPLNPFKNLCFRKGEKILPCGSNILRLMGDEGFDCRTFRRAVFRGFFRSTDFLLCLPYYLILLRVPALSLVDLARDCNLCDFFPRAIASVYCVARRLR